MKISQPFPLRDDAFRFSKGVERFDHSKRNTQRIVKIIMMEINNSLRQRWSGGKGKRDDIFVEG